MTTTRKKTLLHCGILTGILGAVVLLIFLVHPGCVYGAQTDWSNQHFAIPEYFRTRFYATGNLFPNFAMQLGSGQNIFNFAYYGLYSPVILLSFAFPWLSMATYLQISNILLTLLSAFLCYFWLRKWFVPNLSLFMAVLYLLAAPVIFHSHHHIMFVNYFPFLFWALFAVHHALEKRCSLSLIAASACILLTSFFFSVGAFFAILIYAVFLTLHQHHVHLFRQLMRTIGITCLHLLLGAVLAAFLLLPVAWTLIHGRDVSGSSQSLWSLLMPGMHLNYLTYSPFSIGMTSFSILAICAMLCFPQRAYRFLAGIFGVILACPLLLYLMNGTMYLDPKAYIPLLPLLLLLCGFFWRQLRSRQILLKPHAAAVCIGTGVGYPDQQRHGCGADRSHSGRHLYAARLCAVSAPAKHPETRQVAQAPAPVPTLAFSIATCLAVNLGDTYMTRKDVDIVYSNEIQTLTDQVAADDDSFYRISNEYHVGDTVNRIWKGLLPQFRLFLHSQRIVLRFYFHQATKTASGMRQ
ncbi:MAG: YfhO family protein [Ruminococcus callidus]